MSMLLRRHYAAQEQEQEQALDYPETIPNPAADDAEDADNADDTDDAAEDADDDEQE